MSRLEFRVPEKTKKELEQAAELLGLSLTAFATDALMARARQVKREHAQTTLRGEDSRLFLQMLAIPPKPKKVLVKLMSGGKKK